MHTPGHAGGTAFRKSVVGKAFYDFYGENLVRTDLSVSLGPLRALGSLLDHSGKVGESERNAARIFGADDTFYVLNGTSTANEIVGHSCITAGDLVDGGLLEPLQSAGPRPSLAVRLAVKGGEQPAREPDLISESGAPRGVGIHHIVDRCLGT